MPTIVPCIRSLKGQPITDKAGRVHIYLRFISGTKVCYFGTGCKIDPKYWHESRIFQPKTPRKAELRQQFEKVYNRLKTAIEKVEGYGQAATVDLVRMEFNRRPDPPRQVTTFVAVMDEYRRYLQAKPASVNTLRQHDGAVKKLLPLIGSLEPHQIDGRVIDSIRQTFADQGLSMSRITQIMAFFKAATRKAEARGIAVHPAYRSQPAKVYRRTFVALELAELRRLEALELTGSLADARDAFLLAAYTGLRIADLLSLQPGHIQGDNIVILTGKRKTIATIPLLRPAAAILDRYDGRAPQITENSLRRLVKVIGRMAGLNDPIEQVVQTGKGPRRRTVPKWQALHPHSAIKSFVRLGYGLGLTIETIAAITGKTAQTIRAHYLELSRETEAQKAREAFRKLDL